MEIRRDIRQQYSVPAGYFEGLETRLSKIAVAEDAPSVENVPVSLWTKIKPYASLAAVFATAIIGGTFILNRTGGVTTLSQGSLEELMYADLIPITCDIYQMEQFFQEEEEYYLSDDEFMEYMLQTGTTLDQIEEINY